MERWRPMKIKLNCFIMCFVLDNFIYSKLYFKYTHMDRNFEFKVCCRNSLKMTM